MITDHQLSARKLHLILSNLKRRTCQLMDCSSRPQSKCEESKNKQIKQTKLWEIYYRTHLLSYVILFALLSVVQFSKLYTCMNLPATLHEQDMTQSQSFMWSLTDLNIKFFFSYIGCYSKAKECRVCPTIWPIAGREDNWIHSFPKVKCKQPHPGFELGSLCPFARMVIVVKRLYIYMYECGEDWALQPRKGSWSWRSKKTLISIQVFTTINKALV